MNKKYVIYCRVSPRGSTYDKENTSVGMQQEICREFIARQGGSVAGVYIDDLITGTNTDRPGLQEILSQLEAGAEWDHLCVYRMDRLTRSLLDQLTICSKFSKANKGIISVTEPNFDYSSSIGKLQMAQLAAVNEYYRDVVADNTRNKMMSIAASGEWAPGTTPLGYVRAGKKDNRLVIDPRGAAKVRDIFQMYSGEHQTLEIANKYGYNRQQILAMLRNRVYIGKIVYAGKEYSGKHDPIIAAEQFERVQQMLPDRKTGRRPKSEKYKYLLTGLVRCHCGRHMSPAAAKGGLYHYYVCTDFVNCKNRVSAPDLERAVVEQLQNNAMPSEAREKMIAECERRRVAYLASCTPEMNALETARRRAISDREKIYNLMLELPVSEAKFLNDKLHALTIEIDTLDGQLKNFSDLKDSKAVVYNEVRRLIEEISNLSDLLGNHPESFEIKRQLLVANVESICCEDKKKYRLFYNWGGTSNRQIWQPRQDSNLS